MRSILLLGNYRPTLTLVRKLAPLGYRIIVTRGGGEGCSEFSRYVSECWDHPPIEDEISFFAALNDFLRQRTDIEVVLPVWEPCVIGLAKHQKFLPQDRVYATPSSSIVQQCLNKLKMVEFGAMFWLAIQAPIHMTWSWQDPVPTLALFAKQLPVLSELVSSSFKRPVGTRQDPKGLGQVRSHTLKATNA